MRTRFWFGAALFSASLLSSASSPAQLPPTTPRPAPVAGPVEQALLLEGKPFPPVRAVELRLPEPKRTFFVAAKGEAGDGSESRPWNDIQAALARLTPGDRLRVRAGSYARTLSIEAGCADGSERQPIQVVFDGKAALEPPDGSPAIVVSRAHWLIVGPYVRLGSSPSPGIVLRGQGAHDLRLEGARVSDGMGPGIRVDPEAARVTIRGAYVSKSGLAKMGPSSFGIEIAAGTREVDVSDSHLANNPSGSIRVRAPLGAGERAARDLQIRGNSVRDDGSTAIGVDAADGVTIADNTLTDATGVANTRGIAVERAERASVRTNRLTGFSVGISVGRAEPNGGPVRAASDVTVERNVIECTAPRERAAAFVLEAGSGIRIVNNLADGCGQGVLVFGAPPQTERVVVANDVFLRISDVAILLQNPSAATLFDWNVYSPAGRATVEIGGRSTPLSRFLQEGTMPHSQIKVGVHVQQHDVARLSGLATVDRGTKVEGLQFRGAAPDLGVAER